MTHAGWEPEGEVEGITYRAEGSGPPLLLFPLDLAPSQWDPLLAELTARFSVQSGAGAGSSPAREEPPARADAGTGSRAPIQTIGASTPSAPRPSTALATRQPATAISH